MFKVGQKIVCINDSNLPMQTLVLNEIYTIESFKDNGGLLLKDAYNGAKFGAPYFYGYRPDRFRPLDESFAEALLSEIAEEIEQEELILI